jgi:hypothetical protein
MSNKSNKSYMNLGLHLEGQEPVFLRVPTLWDSVELQWIGFVQLPISKHIISAKGQSSFELEGNFNIEISKAFKDEKYVDELFSLFKPYKECEKE